MDVEETNPTVEDATVVTETRFMLDATHTEGLKLHGYEYVNASERNESAVVVVCHGYCDHARGESVAAITQYGTAERGLTTYAIDLTGFGETANGVGQTLGLIPSFQYLDEDILVLLGYVRELHPNKPVYLVGESMGGAVCIQVARMLSKAGNAVDGVVLFAPMVGISEEQKPPSWQIPLLKGMAFLAPKWAVVPAKDNVLEDCFTDPEVIARVEADPLHYAGKPRLKSASELLAASEEVYANMEELDTPFLVLHSRDDLMCPYAHSEELVQRASTQDKTLVSYDGLKHALPVEPNGVGKGILATAFDWIEERVRAIAQPEASASDNQ